MRQRILIAQTFVAAAIVTANAQAGTVSEQNQEYSKCRNAALSDHERSVGQVRQHLETCRLLYPGAYRYRACMKLKTALKKKGSSDTCLAVYEDTLLGPDAGLPFFLLKGKLVFAGLGLGRAFPPESVISQSPYNCQHLSQMMAGGKGGYSFLGNSPNLFSTYAEDPWQKAWKKRNPTNLDNGWEESGLGIVYHSVGAADAVVYIPHGYCELKPRSHKIFSNARVYFVKQGKSILPYAGSVQINPNAKITPANLFNQVTQQFRRYGSRLKPRRIRSHRPGVTLLAAAPPPAWTQDGEPKNYCADPAQSPLIGLIKSEPNGKKIHSMSIILTEALCAGFEATLSTWLGG